jgi:hypothetical protein
MPDKPKNSLDLHGKRYAEVAVLVEDHDAAHDFPYVIITGNSKKMKEVTKKTLLNLSLDYIDDLPNLGCLTVTGTKKK